MDPEMISQQAGAGTATPPPATDPAAQDPDAGADQGDTGPLSGINMEPAENGGVIATHHPKISDRVKNMDHDSVKPRKHALKSHEDAVEHFKKHIHRLKT